MSKQYPALVLQLTDRKPSSFIMKGTENSDNPDRLDTSSQFVLLNHSYILMPGKTKTDPKVQKIGRWISGCESFLVEEQEKMNASYNPQRDMIVFEFGTLTVNREGNFVGLYDFLKAYDGNISNPNRPSGVPPCFMEINTAIEAEVRVENAMDEMEAMRIISQYSKVVKGANGTKEFQYDEDKLRWLCKLFNLTTNDTGSEMLEAVIIKAKVNPILFCKTIEDITGDIRVVVKTATQIGVVFLDGQRAVLADDNSTIINLKGKSMNDKMEELVEYLTSPEGEMMNSVIRTQVEHGMQKMSSSR